VVVVFVLLVLVRLRFILRVCCEPDEGGEPTGWSERSVPASTLRAGTPFGYMVVPEVPIGVVALGDTVPGMVVPA
jgi:hypothetical protein